MKKSEWLDCQGNEFFPKQKGTPSLVKIEHKNTATLDSARSKNKSKVAVLQLTVTQEFWVRILADPDIFPLELLQKAYSLLSYHYGNLGFVTNSGVKVTFSSFSPSSFNHR